MTTGELLDSKSTVSNTTALIHLQNIGGSGIDRYIPYTDMIFNINRDIMEINVAKKDLVVNMQVLDIDIDISDRYLAINIDKNDLEVNNVCD